jgi:murein DD-endopeptidase MepM/ murein hydrolase activator NlpD
MFGFRRNEVDIMARINPITRARLLGLVAGCCLALLAPGCNVFGPPNLPFVPLEFPFSNTGDILRIAAFNIPNWSGTEPHNGIDLIISESMTSARIISPTAGVVKSIDVHENSYSHPPGQLIITIPIRINAEWTVNMVLEPGSADADTQAAQLAAISVREGQQIEVGAPIADLLVGPLGYPHLHYMVSSNDVAVCPYTQSSDAARAIFTTLAALPRSSLPDGNICYGEP